MKIKTDFVTNSSSACYILNKKDLSFEQMFLIINHDKVAHKIMAVDYYELPWNVEELETTIKLSTLMDNFDMKHFLREIGVDIEKIEERDY